MLAVRFLKWSGLALLLLVAVAFGAVQFLSRTRAGQKMVLDFIVERVDRSINGELTIDSISSGGLLKAAVLHGVTLVGEDGRPFLEIDAVEVGYQWDDFLDGDVVLSNLELHRPRLTFFRGPGDEAFNFQQIFESDGATPADSTKSIVFRDVKLVDGSVEILLPVDPDDPPSARAITTTVADAPGTFQRIWFESIQADVELAAFASPSDDFAGPVAEVGSLSLIGHLYKDPFILEQLEGEVTWADDKLNVTAHELTLPRTRTEGTITVDFSEAARGDRPAGWALDVKVEAPRYALQDLQWLVPALPDGEGEGGFDVHVTDLAEVRTTFADATLEMGETRLAGDGTFLWNRGMRLQDVRVHADRLTLAKVKELFPDLELPLTGTLEGDATLDGTLSGLTAEGDVTLDEPGHAPTRGTFSGTFHLEEPRGVTDLVADLSEVDYSLLSVFLPANRLAGRGSAHVDATGTFQEGVRYQAQLVHDPDGGLPRSEIAAAGTLRTVDQELVVDVDADVLPLSLTALRTYYPKLPMSGEVNGDIRLTGPLSDLSVTTDLTTPAGRLAVEMRFDARDPSAHYRIEGDLGDFELSKVVSDLPEPTRLSGFVQVEGRGTDPRTASIDALLRSRASRVGEVDVDTARVSVRVRDGVLYVDSADAVAAGVELHATGTMAAHEEGPPGEVRVTFQAESLAGLRPILMQRNILVRDSLTETEVRALLARGIDPDTLPTSEDVAVGGRVTGTATLTGSVKSFTAAGTATLGEVRYRRTLARNAQVTFTANQLPDFGSDVRAHVQADSLDLFGRVFQGLEADIEFSRPGGIAQVTLIRDPDEDYRATARFQLDSLGGRVDLETLELRLDTLGWQLQRPSLITWDERAVIVNDLRLEQTGGSNIQVTAAGAFPLQGEADFDLAVRGLELGQAVHLAQLEGVDLEGDLNVDLRVRGALEQPFILGTFDATDVRFQGYDVQRVAGGLEYRDRRWSINLAAWQNELRMLTATGVVPGVVNLREAALRFPDEPINLSVVADALPAAYVAGVFSALVDVQGTVAGRFQIAGTLDNPAPSGTLELQDAAWTVEPLGVRHENLRGTLTLRPDGVMEVDAVGNADGSARLTGSVKLQPLSNPTFDLQASFDNFRAVDRRDAVGNVSGIVRLTGTFDRPLIEGLGPSEGLRVESGLLQLEEFVRTATVVDLADPRFREYVEDLSELETRIIAESANPFMQALRVNVDLAVAQDTWLRSSEMNVEIAGDLQVNYDRESLRIVLRGVLDARRGDYTVQGLGKSFQVQEGRVEFLGIPGIDPNLNISAVTRVRRQGGEQLNVTARVTGRLTQPQVTLTSDEAGLGEADLVSYLLFGRPSYDLEAGQRQSLGSAASSYGFSYLGGLVSTRLGSVLARQWGLDYFSITEVGTTLDFASVTQSQVEFGKYLYEDLFAVLAFQPAQVVGGASPLGTIGTRLEYSPSPRYTVEGFYEDRFMRQRSLGFQDVGLARKIWGLSLFTEWGF